MSIIRGRNQLSRFGAIYIIFLLISVQFLLIIGAEPDGRDGDIPQFATENESTLFGGDFGDSFSDDTGVTLAPTLDVSDGSIGITPIFMEDFEDGDTVGWNVDDGDWSNQLDGTNRVYAFEKTWGNSAGRTIYPQSDATGDWKATFRMKHENDVMRAGLIFNYQDSSNYYFTYIDSDDDLVYLRKVSGGNGNTLMSTAFAPVLNVWYTLDVIRTGTAITVSIDGLQYLNTNDGDFTTGTFGLASRNIGWWDDTLVYFDDIVILPYQVSGTVVSPPISIPTGQNWDSIMISTNVPAGTSIDLELQDTTGLPISGFDDLNNNGETSIASIDPKIVPTIVIHATINSQAYDTPYLEYWGASWNKTSTWRDTFFMTQKLSSNGGLTPQDGRISGGVTTSIIKSSKVTIPANSYYHTMEASAESPGGSTFWLTLLDGVSLDPIGGLQDLSMNQYDIFGVNPHIHPSVVLQAELQSSGGSEPIMKDWGLNWTLNEPPKIIDISSASSSLYRLSTTSLRCSYLDEEGSQVSTPQFTYLAPGQTTWDTTYLGTTYFSTDHWAVNFTPPSTAPVGDYQFKVNVTDPFALTTDLPLIKMINVMNNFPPQPTVGLTPLVPRTFDDLVAIVTSDPDLEGETITHTYSWYIDGVHQPDLDTDTISSNLTSKGQLWKCVVVPSDGLNIGASAFSEVTVINSPPVIDNAPIPVTMQEDTSDTSVVLKDIFSDADDDPLTYTVLSSNVNLPVTIEDGILRLAPVSNWSGPSDITISANDSVAGIETSFKVTVSPVNDDPIIFKIGDSELKNGDFDLVVFEDRTLSTTIIATDADGDVLSFGTNRTDDQALDDHEGVSIDDGTGDLDFIMYNDDVGILPIEVWVSDNNGSVISYDLELEIKNINDDPWVEITQPDNNARFTADEEIVFKCDFGDDDLIHGDEILTLTWTTQDRTASLGNSSTLQGIDFEPGFHTVTVTIRDGDDVTSTSSINLEVSELVTVGEVDDKSGDSNFLWILIFIIILVLVLVMFAIYYRKKKKEEERLKDEMEGLEKELERSHRVTVINRIPHEPAQLAPQLQTGVNAASAQTSLPATTQQPQLLLPAASSAGQTPSTYGTVGGYSHTAAQQSYTPQQQGPAQQVIIPPVGTTPQMNQAMMGAGTVSGYAPTHDPQSYTPPPGMGQQMGVQGMQQPMQQPIQQQPMQQQPMQQQPMQQQVQQQPMQQQVQQQSPLLQKKEQKSPAQKKESKQETPPQKEVPKQETPSETQQKDILVSKKDKKPDTDGLFDNL